MGNHDYTTLDRARDELYSHIVRCEVLDAELDEHIGEWLEETMDFMAERYPDLSELQLAQLRMMGQRYLEPVIPHGRGSNAMKRDAVEEAPKQETAVPEAAKQEESEQEESEERAAA